jgi:hypothetical protein
VSRIVLLVGDLPRRLDGVGEQLQIEPLRGRRRLRIARDVAQMLGVVLGVDRELPRAVAAARADRGALEGVAQLDLILGQLLDGVALLVDRGLGLLDGVLLGLLGVDDALVRVAPAGLGVGDVPLGVGDLLRGVGAALQ